MDSNHYLQSEEERRAKVQEVEKFRKREEEERQNKENAERRAKLDAIAEKQRQRERELEEKEKLRKEALRGKLTEPFARPTEPFTSAAASSQNTRGKYVPKHLRQRAAAPPESDQFGRPSDRTVPKVAPPEAERLGRPNDCPTLSRTCWSLPRPR